MRYQLLMTYFMYYSSDWLQNEVANLESYNEHDVCEQQLLC